MVLVRSLVPVALLGFGLALATGACSGSFAGMGEGDGGSATCTPRACADDACGTIDDGCGRALDCGGCEGTTQCVDNQCKCTPRSCASAGATCGQLTDGCTGNVLFCGTCEGEAGAPAGDAGSDAGDGGLGAARLYCGADNRCAPVPCTPKTKDELCKVVDKNVRPCGMIADGCGGVVDCAATNCTGTGQTCGGGGVEGRCGCKPKTTGTACSLGTCGNVANGCGGYVYCGSCK
ncbi:MAG: hypothetical protein U0183_12110 [Polyangiaceae bacterium]